MGRRGRRSSRRSGRIQGYRQSAGRPAVWSEGIGTAAHCFTLVHDSERDAFESQIEALGKNTTLLVDTYNIEEAVNDRRGGRSRTGWRAHRLRRPSAMAQRVRNQLDAWAPRTPPLP